MAKGPAKDSDEYQRLAGTVSPLNEGEEAHPEEGDQTEDARYPVIHPLLQIEVVRKLSHRSGVSRSVPYDWRVVDQSE